MNIQDLGSIGEFISSIIVLVTVIYLARQVGQAKNAMLLAAVQSQRAEVQASFRSVRDSPYIPKIAAKASRGEALDGEEEQRLGAHIALQWSLIYSTWAQRTLSGADALMARDDIQIAGAMENFGGRGLTWWDGAGRHIYPDEFIAYIDGKIATLPGSDVHGLASLVASRAREGLSWTGDEQAD